MEDNREVLLSVRHLKQYFRFGRGEFKYNKAVHDVSFDIHRGEVFGLVGESGCGKTTTGRSIIKLYNITSGDVYFKGVRVSAGTRWNEKEIKYTLIRLRETISRLNRERQAEIDQISFDGVDVGGKDRVTLLKKGLALEKKKLNEALKKLKIKFQEDSADLITKYQNDTGSLSSATEVCKNEYEEKVAKLHEEFVLKEQEVLKEIEAIEKEKKAHLDEYVALVNQINAKYDALIKEEKEKANNIVTTQKREIKQAIYDTKHCNDQYRKQEIAKVHEEYDLRIKESKEKLDTFSGDKNSPEFLKLKEEHNDLLDEFNTKLALAKKAVLMNKMQMIFQDPIASIDPRMTVKEIIAEGYRIRGVRNDKFINQKVDEVLNLVGLVPEHASRYPHEFSGGQRQRIGIARAIIMEPELIIADEPVSALDVSIQAQVINLLNNLKETQNYTIMFIAHDLSVVKYFCDRIAVMYFGQMVELTTSDELFKHPFHPYTRSLLSAIPHPDPNYEKNRVRLTYNPNVDHDYSEDKPVMQEVYPGHLVYCNSKELERYRKEYNDSLNK